MAARPAPDEFDERFDDAPEPVVQQPGPGTAPVPVRRAPRSEYPYAAPAAARPAAELPDMTTARKVAWWLDDLVTIPGTRIGIGLDAVVGLIPGIGDGAGTVLAGFVLVEGVRQGVPLVVIVRMILNLLIDAALGMLPFVGDLADAAHRANRKNMRLIERTVADPEHVRRTSVAYVIVASILIALTLGGMLVLAALAIWMVWTALSRVF